MKKFTIFTIILTIVVAVVIAELLAKDYFATDKSTIATEQSGDGMKLTLPKSLDIKKSIETNVLGSDGSDSGESTGGLVNRLRGEKPVASVTAPEKLPEVSDSKLPDYLDPNTYVDVDKVAVDVTNKGKTDGVKDFEDENFISTANNVYLRDEQIKSAGFVGAYLEDEPLDGKFFKTIDVSDLGDVTVTKTDIRTKEAILAKAYIFKIGLNTNVSEVYQILKMRALQGLNIKLNETNEFGLASFYMNDPTRTDTAFLTVRISGMIYAFSYPKTYHSQIKNLLQLIQWELG